MLVFPFDIDEFCNFLEESILENDLEASLYFNLFNIY